MFEYDCKSQKANNLKSKYRKHSSIITGKSGVDQLKQQLPESGNQPQNPTFTVRSRRSLSRDKNDAQIHKIKDGLNDHKQSVGSFYNTYSNQLNSSFA